ncbi:stealth family protein [Paeniglutamicibacter terrestris]|uniref:Sugar phosphotransferase n=1 Tax=Paeniglutamicibacter terrestris TaxID=2723403 RepID=A0ABX1G8U6_9MICC|nr:stealth family protein [Paeniglutamicibacter terrestris]NKG22686.1 hypothetical protein [Paeniglutamicibacter terrestris]
MSLISGWKGRVGALIPPSYWQHAIALVDRKTPAAITNIASLRQMQAEAMETVIASSGLKVHWANGVATVNVGPNDATELRALLSSAGFSLEPIMKEALSQDAIAGWSCATRSQVGRRRDLTETIGVRLLVASGGQQPTSRNLLDVRETIDLVYTWVDGSDEEWKANRLRAEDRITGELPPTANDEARYQSHDELRFSLRSVEAFLPWVNQIFIVTAGQHPAWLDTDNPKITLVDHADIFEDPAALPTFNSHSIESQLYRIPNLSERFLYVNDDVFFGRPLGKQVFYTPTGYPKFSLSDARFDLPETANLPVNIAARNNNRLLASTFGMTTSHKFKHVAHAQLMSTLKTIAETHPAEVTATAKARFRSESDLSIPSALAHYYGCAMGAAFPADVDYRYIDLGSESAQQKIARLFLQKRPQMFCLNEVTSTPARTAEVSTSVEQFLQRMFPWPSSFETP